MAPSRCWARIMGKGWRECWLPTRRYSAGRLCPASGCSPTIFVGSWRRCPSLSRRRLKGRQRPRGRRGESRISSRGIPSDQPRAYVRSTDYPTCPLESRIDAGSRTYRLAIPWHRMISLSLGKNIPRPVRSFATENLTTLCAYISRAPYFPPTPLFRSTLRITTPSTLYRISQQLT